MSRIIYHFMALCVIALFLGGCPLLNPLLAAPEGAFEASPTSGEAPLTVLFIDASDGGTTNITEWQWDFGDGSTSSSRNPSHIYEVPGLYTVSLTVTSSVGTHTALKRNYVNVVQSPTANFSATPVLGNSPLNVTFTDTSDSGSADIIDWQWNFGDRTPTSAEQNPAHQYTAPGLYTVSLTVTTAVDSDTMEQVQYINVVGAPVADFTTDTTQGTAPLMLAFTDASDTGTAAITGWAWDFGDETMSTDQNPSHTYTAPGTYTVSLTIETEVGPDTVVRENLIVVEEGPTAAFTGDPLMGPAPLSVIFTDGSSAGSTAITNWLWDFGDGGLLSTLQNPTRIYNVPGVYTVSLRVTTPVGENTLEQPEYITVLPGVSFTGNETTGEGAVTVQFVDQSATGDFEISAWAWDFGDGAMSDLQNPEHTYAEPDSYDVTLTISTSLGDSTNTEAGFITVSPATAFSADPVIGPPPLEVTFTDETEAGAFEISAWAWDFGDSTDSTDQNPVHSYDTPGLYSVSLQTTTAIGNTSETRTGLIQVEPVVAMTASSTSGQGTLTVDFTDQSDTGNLNILSWFWDFGDGANSTEQNPAHTYQGIGTYSVALTVTTSLGDTTKTETDFIKVGPVVDFNTDVQQGAGTLTVTFTDLTDGGSLAIEKWAWMFGDGMVSDEQNPVHDYRPGQYSVTLTVTTSQGATSTTKTDLILVEPVVDINFVQAAGPAPFEASLLDVTDPGTLEITTWNWNFGDGQTSTEQNPVHVFANPGTYTVTLTITTSGGDFSVTEADFITAQAGPTALFTESIARGGNAEDPVTVSFTNMSTLGDSPILNQTWDFGESAIFVEEDTMAENPTVTYPGTAFDTIPQNVSLTTRTFIAEDTLLKENLFNAPITKIRLDSKSLWMTEFHIMATNRSGDVWAAGTLPRGKGETTDTVIVRMNPAGKQRWGVALEADVPLDITGLCAAPDGSLTMVGTLRSPKNARVYLACFSGTGEVLWERVIQGTVALHSAGITLDTSGGFVATGHTDSSRLFLIRGDLPGSFATLLDTDYHLTPGLLPITAVNATNFLLGTPENGVVEVRSDSDKAVVVPWLEKGSAGASKRTVTLHWDAEHRVLRRTLSDGKTLWIDAGGMDKAVSLALDATTPHTLDSREDSGGGDKVIWLERDFEAESWVVRSTLYGP